jgi:hypothetical protein
MSWVAGPLWNFVTSIWAIISDDKEEQWVLSGCYSTAPAIVEVLFPSSISNHETDHCLGLLQVQKENFQMSPGKLILGLNWRGLDRYCGVKRKAVLHFYFKLLRCRRQRTERKLHSIIYLLLVSPASYLWGHGLDSRPAILTEVLIQCSNYGQSNISLLDRNVTLCSANICCYHCDTFYVTEMLTA